MMDFSQHAYFYVKDTGKATTAETFYKH